MPEQVKIIERVERATTSVNGNPAWMVYFTDGTYARTQSDAMWSYEADNAENRGVPLLVTFTRSGRIAYARRDFWTDGDLVGHPGPCPTDEIDYSAYWVAED